MIKKTPSESPFKGKFVAESFESRKSPFSISDATNFTDKVTLADTLTSTHTYSLTLGRNYPTVKPFYQCSPQQLSNQLCTIKTLVEARINCKTISVPSTHWQGSTETKECEVSLTTTQPYKEGRLTEVKEITLNLLYQASSEALAFLANKFPKVAGKTLKTIDPKGLAQLALISGEPGLQFKESYVATSSKVTNRAHAIFNPEETNAPGYFNPENIDQIDPGKTFKADSGRVIENRQITNTYSKFSITSKVGDWTNKITLGFNPNTGKYLWASPQPQAEATLSNWQQFLTKCNMSTERLQPQVLKFSTQKQASLPNPERTNTSWSDYFKTPTIERSSDIMLYNLVPAGVGTLLALHSGKFAKDSLANTKKTYGQRVTGAIIGALGAAAGLTLVYERLSQLNLKPQ